VDETATKSKKTPWTLTHGGLEKLSSSKQMFNKNLRFFGYSYLCYRKEKRIKEMTKKLFIIASISIALATVGGINSSQADKCTDALTVSVKTCQSNCGSGIAIKNWCGQACDQKAWASSYCSSSCSDAVNRLYTLCYKACDNLNIYGTTVVTYCKNNGCTPGKTAGTTTCK